MKAAATSLSGLIGRFITIRHSAFLTLLSVAALLVSTPATAQTAAELYKSKCAVCHAADGSGNTAMGKKTAARDFRAPEVQKQSDSELIAITTKGKNKMPGYQGKLTEAQIKDLVGYIRGMMKSK
jgi:mono/diheme cytochrome c family protein